MKRLLQSLLLLAGFSLFFPATSFAAEYHGVVGIDYSQDAGNMFYCASTGTVTTQAGVSASSPTISLYNPSGSGKNLTVLEVYAAAMSIPAGLTQVSLAYNVVSSSGVRVDTNSLVNVNGSTPTVTSALVGKNLSSSTVAYPGTAKCFMQSWLPATPVLFRYIGAVSSSTLQAVWDQTNGKVVVPPGGLLSLQTSAAANLQAHILWREDPQ